MSEETYEQQILKAVDILTEGAIKDLKFDKTILATVESIENITTGEHKVRFQDGSFSAFTSPANLYYAPGSLVYVQIPQGDFSEKKIITGGKTQLAGDQLSDHLNDFIENTYAEDAFKWIQSWWQTTDPSLGWTDGKAIHEGDFWYNTSNNNYSRYTKISEGVYEWENIQGINALSGLLSNENASVISNADGSVSDFTSTEGTFYVYEGSNLASADFSVVANSEVNCSAIIDAITGEYSLTNFSSTELAASVTFKATLNGTEITKVFTIAKIVEGLSAKAVKLESSSYAIPYAADGSTPSLTSLSLTITESNLEAPIYYEFFIDGESVQDPSTLSTYSYSSPTSWFNTPKTLRVEAREGFSTNPVVATDSISIVAIKPGLDGSDGANGLPGAPGKDGLTPYFHTAWATSADGETGFSTTISTDKTYLGTYTDHTEEDSNTPSDYNWSLIKGADGHTPVKDVDYFDGVDGQDGVSAYLWIRYSINSDGSEMTPVPTNALYIGTATTTINTAPTDYSSYSWTLIKGDQGVAGETGPNGQTSYLHIKYSNDRSTFTGNDGEDVGIYIGTYVDFTQADSSTFTDYTWNKVVGDEGPPAVVGILTNENHTFTANSAGVVSNYAEGVSEIRVYYGATLLTAQNTGTDDPSEDNKYTVTSISNTSGTITLMPSLAGNQYKITPSDMTTDTAVRTLTIKARIDGVIHTLTKVLTYSKAKAGADAEIYELKINPTNLVRGKDGVLSPSYLTLSATKTVGNGTPEDYSGLFEIYEDGEINPNGPFSPVSPATSINYTPTTSTVKQIQVELYDGEVLLDSQSAVVVDDATGGNLLYTNEWVETSEITNNSFPHWSVTTITETPDIINQSIELVSGPYNTMVNACNIKTNNTGVDVKVSMISSDFQINNTQKYRFIVWFKKVTESGGTIYIGTDGYKIEPIVGNLDMRPYFAQIDNADGLQENEWYLFVGHINPYNEDIEDNSSGIYNLEGIKLNNIVTNFKWNSGATSTNFNFSSGNNSGEEEVVFYAPRVDLCDGNEIILTNFFPVFDMVKYLENYYSNSFQDLNDDSIISASEKRNLLEFWRSVQTDYLSLVNKISNNAILNSNTNINNLLESLDTSYSALDSYLNIDLAIFANMSIDTPLLASVARTIEFDENGQELPGGSTVVDMLVTEIEETTDVVYFDQIGYWDKKWDDYLRESKPILEEEMLKVQLEVLSSSDVELTNLTNYVMDEFGNIKAVTDKLIFTDDGLEINTTASDNKTVINETSIQLFDSSGNLSITINGDNDKITVNSLDELSSIQLGEYSFTIESPASHLANQLVIKR